MSSTVTDFAVLRRDPHIEAISKRASPAALVIDAFDRIVMANERALSVLRRLGAETPDSRELPAIVADALGEIAAGEDREAESAFAPLAADLCVRTCRLSSTLGPYRLLLFEEPRRRGLIPLDLSRYGITPREREAALLVLEGISNRKIADRLFLSEYTVEGYLKQIFVKLSVRSRTALVAKLLGWSDGSQP